MPEDVPNSAHRSRCLRFMNEKETAERGSLDIMQEEAIGYFYYKSLI